jgi:hypothetical protein
MSKFKFKVSLDFEYDQGEEAPLTGKVLTHPDHAIDQVRYELENIPVGEFIIKCEVHDENGFLYAIKSC